MQSRTKVSLVAAALLVGIGAAWAAWEFRLSPKAKMVQRVRATLHDPWAARFEDLVYNSRNGYLCGQVNAKNRLGAYVGFKHFIARPNGLIEVTPEELPNSAPVVDRIARTEKKIEYVKRAMNVCAKSPPS